MNIADQLTPVNQSNRGCNICTAEDLQSPSFSLSVFYRSIFITYSKRGLNQESYVVVSTGSGVFNFFSFPGNFGTLHMVNVGPYYMYCQVEFSAFGADASPLKLALGV